MSISSKVYFYFLAENFSDVADANLRAFSPPEKWLFCVCLARAFMSLLRLTWPLKSTWPWWLHTIDGGGQCSSVLRWWSAVVGRSYCVAAWCSNCYCKVSPIWTWRRTLRSEHGCLFIDLCSAMLWHPMLCWIRLRAIHIVKILMKIGSAKFWQNNMGGGMLSGR